MAIKRISGYLVVNESGNRSPSKNARILIPTEDGKDQFIYTMTESAGPNRAKSPLAAIIDEADVSEPGNCLIEISFKKK